MSKLIKLTILGVFFLSYSLPALSFTYFACTGFGNGYQQVDLSSGAPPLKWGQNTINFEIDTNMGFHYSNAVYYAVGQFNKNPSNFRITTSSVSPEDIGIGNNRNQIWFTGADIGSAGVAFLRMNCATNEIVETNIVLSYTWRPQNTTWTDPNAMYVTRSFNKNAISAYNGWDFSVSPPVPDELPLSFQALVLHELGHAAGLGHEPHVNGMMGFPHHNASTNGHSARYFVDEDMASGLEFLYGTTVHTHENLGAKHWKFGSTDSGNHYHDAAYGTRTLMYDGVSGNLLPYHWIDGEGMLDNVYWVSRGQDVTVEFALENTGKNTQTVDVKLVLSESSLIAANNPNDVVLDVSSHTIERNPSDLYTKTVTIPCSVGDGLSDGYYWVGIYVDPSYSVTEISRLNNAAYTPVRLTQGGCGP